MLGFLLGLFRLVWLFGKGHQAVVLENLALRQQLSIYKRKQKRPRLSGAIGGFGWRYPWCGRSGDEPCAWFIPTRWCAGSAKDSGGTGRSFQADREERSVTYVWGRSQAVAANSVEYIFASSGLVGSTLPPTLGFGLIDEFILQKFEDLIAIATFELTL